MSTYANSSNQIAALKELYKDESDFMKDLVYKEQPFLALIPKDESGDGFAGKYMPVPLEYGVPQGRSHDFATAQANQTPTQLASFFVYIISDYQLVTITNLLMEQTKTKAGAFIDAAKLQIDGGIRNITNNIAGELFGSGTATRGVAGTYAFNGTGNIVTIALSNPQQIVSFEQGMTLLASATDGGAPSVTSIALTNVDRANGIIVGVGSSAAMGANWAPGAFLTVAGDLPAGGVTTTGSFRALSGLAAWLPSVTPALTDNFWGVNRSADPTRLAGCRYDASSMTIEEGLTNALGFLNREGGKPEIAIMDFASYTSLVNQLGAKVQYVQVKHDEVEVAFDAITFQSAYGKVSVLADRNCQPQTCYLLQMNTWKLRSLNKVPHILRYGMEGLEGLRVGNADALEVRIGHYSNLTCSAPGWNCVVRLSA